MDSGDKSNSFFGAKTTEIVNSCRYANIVIKMSVVIWFEWNLAQAKRHISYGFECEPNNCLLVKRILTPCAWRRSSSSVGKNICLTIVRFFPFDILWLLGIASLSFSEKTNLLFLGDTVH